MQIIVNKDFSKAIEKAKEVLYEKVDRETVLFLSGGATPKSLYTSLANDKVITPAAVAMIDERYGVKFHDTSNEKMIAETGFLDYLESRNIPFYPILGKKTTREEASEEYDQVTRDLFFHVHKSLAVMGIGKDGHIAGLAPNRKDFINPLFNENNRQLFVDDFEDSKSDYKERISLTFAGLSLIDFFMVLAFGKEKKKPLQQMFDSGSLEEIPARFFVQQASNNTVVITDQTI